MKRTFKTEFIKLDSIRRQIVITSIKFGYITIIDDRDKNRLNKLLVWCEKNLNTIN